jgi:menaquinone-specific isochorismate synthase
VSSPLVVRTELLDLPDADLLDVLPFDDPVAWLRRGEGMVGWGVAAEVRTSGSTRFADANKWWTETTSRAEVRDEVGEPGTGLVCFGTFAFADEPSPSSSCPRSSWAAGRASPG